MVMLKQVAASQSIVMKKQTNKQQQQQQNVNKISTWLNVYLKYATIQES